MGHVHHLQARGRGGEQVAELQRRRAHVAHRQHRGDARRQRRVHVHHHQAGVGRDVQEVPADGDVAGTGQHAVAVPGQRPLEEVVARLAVGQRVHVHQHQAFFGVHHEGVVVDGVEGLFFVGHAHQLALVAQRRDRLVGGQGHAGGVARGHVGVLAQRRERRADDALRNALVGHRGHVVHAHAAGALGHEQVFAAHRDAARRALGRVVVGHGQLAAARQVRRMPVRIGVALQVAADHRLRLVPFGHLHRADALLGAHPGVQADEVDEVGSLQQQLRHDGVVVVGFRQVAVGAGLGFGLALGVRVVRREGLAGEAAGGDRCLLHVDALAVGVGGRQHQGRARAHGRDLAARDGAGAAQREHVVAHHLRVVGGVVAGLAALVVKALGLPVRLDRQVAARAAGGPRGVAGVAGHLVVVMGVVGRRDAGAPGAVDAPGLARAHGLGARGLGVVVGIARRHRVLDQAHLPLQPRRHRRALEQPAFAPLEAAAAIRRAQQLHVVALRPGGRARSEQRGVLARGAVAVLAADLDGGGHFALDVAVAVRVLAEVAVHAVHARVQVRRAQVHGLLEALGVTPRRRPCRAGCRRARA